MGRFVRSIAMGWLIVSLAACPKPTTPEMTGNRCRVIEQQGVQIHEVVATQGKNVVRVINEAGPKGVSHTMSFIIDGVVAFTFTARQADQKSPLEFTAAQGTQHKAQLSVSPDHVLSGTIDGHPIRPLPLDEAKKLAGSGKIALTDGASLMPSEDDPKLHDAMAGLLKELSGVTGRCQQSAGAGALYAQREGVPVVSGTSENPLSSVACAACFTGCIAAAESCWLAVALSASACGPWSWLCAVIGFLLCVTIMVACELVCAYAVGGPCCPVACPSAMVCCNAGHVCVAPGQCCAVACPNGTGCCNSGDTCFANQLGTEACCPSGRQVCGNQCCTSGERCNQAANPPACCAGDPCGPSLCCPFRSCNQLPATPACCPGSTGSLGGEPCAGAQNAANGCCPAGMRCATGSQRLCCPPDQPIVCGGRCAVAVCGDGSCCSHACIGGGTAPSHCL